MARIGGVAYLKVNGQQYPVRGNFTVSPSRFERKKIAGQDYVHGHDENPRVPFIECDVSTTPEVSIEVLDNYVGDTVSAYLANGKSYVLTNAVSKGAHEINTKDGQVRVRFEGDICDEL